tara:strand:- start:303 stop:1058 length:756 start_codon:yes stop_codon:yes gene_type:complete
MKNALIGHTGFIGSNLKNDIKNCEYYNSKNIEKIENKTFDKIYCTANDSRIWYVNKNPDKDLKNIQSLLIRLQKVKCNFFILISSIEIYKNNRNKSINEYVKNRLSKKLNYGNNRLYFENEIKKLFINHLIVRLPIVYGKNFKKNIIYDIINNKNLHSINQLDVLQFYPVNYLFKDIELLIQNKINVANLASEPLKAFEITNKFNITKNLTKIKRNYNMQSIHSNIFKKNKYRFSKIFILNNIINFIKKRK